VREYLGIYLKELKEPTKSLRIDGVQVEIQTRSLHNKNQES
jgi:hypothetical protein